MLCEKCNKNIANVYIKNSINGKTTESYLCSACAGLYGQNYANLSEGDFASDIFNALNFGKFPSSAAPAAKNTACPMCGLTFADIAQSGKAGCGKCYATFKSEFEPNVIRIHGTSRHTGKIPKHMSARLNAKRRLDDLGTKLKKVIADQNFEEAAQIRDEINKIKSEGVEA